MTIKKNVDASLREHKKLEEQHNSEKQNKLEKQQNSEKQNKFSLFCFTLPETNSN